MISSIVPGTPRGAAEPHLPRLRRVSAFAAPERRAIAGVAALTVAAGVVSAVDPLVVRSIVDHVVARDPVRQLAIGAAVLMGLLLAREALSAFGNWLTWRVRLRIHASILEATVSRLHALSVSFHQGEPGGARLTRLDRAIAAFVSAFSELAFNTFPALVFLAVATFMMARLEWRLLLVIAVVVPLPALAGVRAAPVQAERDRRLLDRWARIYGRFNEVLDGIVTVKSFAMERAERQRFTDGVSAANALVARGVGLDARVSFLQNTLGSVARVVVIGYGGLLALRGQISVGTLLAFAGYLGGLFGPVQGLTNVYQTVYRASAALDVIFSILDSKEEVLDAPDARVLHAVGGTVAFDDVHFGYLPERPVLSGVSFEVTRGETVALMGPSGSGKSTLMALLQRLHEPQRGAIRVDGVDVRTVSAPSLRRQIGVVLQEPLLFDDTVRANLAYGRPEATQAEIEEAARAANAHDFIARLPHGYETQVGARGARLSAGQRQRIAIARALLKRPSIVVLDEATSALDAESETLVREALERLLAGRTTFVIAHGFANAVRADRVLVLRGGSIVESGTHATLLAADGVYAQLFKLHARGLSADSAA